MRILQRSFDRWLDSLDPAVRVASQSLRDLVLPALAALGITAITAFAPHLRDFFHLDFAASVLCLAPAVVFGLATRAWDARVGYSRLGYGIAVWVGSLLVQFYTCSLVTLSRPPGSFAIGGAFLLAASYHGLIYRSTPATPFISIATLLAMLGAYAFDPYDEALSEFAILGPTAISAALLLGSRTVRSDRERLRESALRSAIQAQTLESRSGDVRRLSVALLGMLQRNHDAGNALSTSLLSSEFLVALTGRQSLEEHERDEAHEVALQLRGALLRLKELVDETRRFGSNEIPEGGAEATPVVPLRVARRVSAELADRFPSVRITCHGASDRAATLAAEICGGEETLYRMLENLVLNACQGNGTSTAADVAIFVRDDPHVGALIVQVIDDGPGFTDAQLAGPIEAFATTKPGGTGLGLYTTERLVRASGGSLQRANGLDGGAVVTLYLLEASSP